MPCLCIDNDFIVHRHSKSKDDSPNPFTGGAGLPFVLETIQLPPCTWSTLQNNGISDPSLMGREPFVMSQEKYKLTFVP